MVNGLKKIWKKWLNSFIGIGIAIKEEKSLWVYLVIAPIIIGLGIWLKLSFEKWAIVITVIFLTITVEVINTSIEAAVDAMSFQYNIKVRKIKDIAAGATFVMTLCAAIVLLIIFIPEIKEVI